MMIRKAITKEVKPIHSLLSHYAEKGVLLPRSLSELYDHLRDLYVFVDVDKTILGVCALGVCWEDLAEIRSLAVAEEHQGKRLGAQLVEKCLEEAKDLGIKKVFALTYVPRFFKKIGFQEIDKSVLPHKIWADCLKCAKFPDCDEIAMMLEL
jgi:amino-acid N-acetyltransferase